MSPLQYQKQLRLQEARQLTLNENLDAGGAAVNVGYESASQFSRESQLSVWRAASARYHAHAARSRCRRRPSSNGGDVHNSRDAPRARLQSQREPTCVICGVEDMERLARIEDARETDFFLAWDPCLRIISLTYEFSRS